MGLRANSLLKLSHRLRADQLRANSLLKLSHRLRANSPTSDRETKIFGECQSEHARTTCLWEYLTSGRGLPMVTP